MSMCIYCLENKPKNLFNKDHVIPEAFGSFKSAPTLVDSVCRKCNQYFGDTLELFLGRDTLEGMLRYKYGVKNAKNIKFLRKSRIIFKIAEEGHWRGALIQLKYSPVQKMMVADPITQVGFQKKDSKKWDFFELDEIISKDDLEKRGYVVKGKRTLKILFGPDIYEKEKIEQALIAKGIKVETFEEETLPFNYCGKEIRTEIHGTIDKIIYRGFAKISFNYLTYIFGKEFALDSNFNEIRNFIRNGITDGFKYVAIQKEPILYNEKRLKRFNIKETCGHMITIGWTRGTIGIVSQVTLFNDLIYRVILCRRFDGIYREISSGHHFDINSKTISRMFGITQSISIINR